MPPTSSAKTSSTAALAAATATTNAIKKMQTTSRGVISSKKEEKQRVQHDYHDYADLPEREEERSTTRFFRAIADDTNKDSVNIGANGTFTASSGAAAALYDREASGSSSSACLNLFPIKLYFMLLQTEKEGLEEVVSWQPHGRCLQVHDAKRFVSEILHRFFSQSKLTSFQRQLNLYGFKRITRGKDKGGYYHELFLRGKPFLCHRIGRVRVKGTWKRQPGSPEQEPDLYAYESLMGERTTKISESNRYSVSASTVIAAAAAAAPVSPDLPRSSKKSGNKRKKLSNKIIATARAEEELSNKRAKLKPVVSSGELPHADNHRSSSPSAANEPRSSFVEESGSSFKIPAVAASASSAVAAGYGASEEPSVLTRVASLDGLTSTDLLAAAIRREQLAAAALTSSLPLRHPLTSDFIAPGLASYSPITEAILRRRAATAALLAGAGPATAALSRLSPSLLAAAGVTATPSVTSAATSFTGLSPSLLSAARLSEANLVAAAGAGTSSSTSSPTLTRTVSPHSSADHLSLLAALQQERLRSVASAGSNVPMLTRL